MFGFIDFFAIVKVENLSRLFLSIGWVEEDVAKWVADCEDIALIVVFLVKNDTLIFVGVVEERSDDGLLSAHDITILAFNICQQEEY